jgi:hypothetical protein
MVAKNRIAMNANRVNKKPLYIISDANRSLKLLVPHSNSIFVIVSTAIK